MAARRFLATGRRAFDPSNTASSLARFGSGELLWRASLLSALRLPGFVPCARLALRAAVDAPASANPLVRGGGGILRAVSRRVLERQFVAGADAASALATAAALRSRGVGAIVDHSVEDAVDLDENRARKMDLIRAVAGTGAAVPVKPTAVADAGALRELAGGIRASADPAAARLDPRLAESLERRDAYEDALSGLETITAEARRCGVKILLDAERSEVQPAVDHVALACLRRFSEPGAPALYNTYQCYLRGSDQRLALDAAACAAARAPFGCKIVRGAYLADEADALRPTKADTDRAYDAAVASLLEHMARGDDAHLFIASHNAASAGAAVDAMDGLGLSRSDGRVTFAQILGMCDSLTDELAGAGCNVSKLVLFGDFGDLAPWIGRRLEENQDALGAPTAEGAVLWGELRRRLTTRDSFGS